MCVLCVHASVVSVMDMARAYVCIVCIFTGRVIIIQNSGSIHEGNISAIVHIIINKCGNPSITPSLQID